MNIRQKFLRKTGVLVLLGMLLVPGAFAQAEWQASLGAAISKQGLTMADFEEICTFYYKNPQPEKLIPCLEALLSIDALISDQGQFGSFAHFFAAIAHKDEGFIEKLRLLKSSYSGLQQQAADSILKDAENFVSPDADSPDHLDYLWSEFFATGDSLPIEKIINVLGTLNPDQNNPDTPATPMGQLIHVARWSLGSNAKQHEAVRKILEQKSVSAVEPARSILKAILIFNDLENKS